MDTRTNEIKKQMLNFPEWYDYMLRHPLKEKLVICIWDTKDKSSHGYLTESIREIFYSDGLPHNVAVLYKEFSGQVQDDCKWMLDNNVKICNISLTKFDLTSYFDEYPIVSQFCDKVFIVNSAGNDGDKPIKHPAPPPELTVGACGYRFMEKNKIGWLEYSNHEDGFVADTYGFSEWYLRKYDMVFNGTSSSGPSVFFGIILPIFHFYLYNKGRLPTTSEVNKVTYLSNYIEFDSKIGTLKLCVLPRLESMIMGLTHLAIFTIGSADYVVDGIVRHMDTALIAHDNTTFAPLRKFVELQNEFAPCKIDEERLWNEQEPTKVKLYITEI